MKRTIAITALALAACATPMTPEQRAEALIHEYGPACVALGLQYGQPEYAQCIMEHDRQHQQAEAASWNALAKSLKDAGNALNPPTYTTTCVGGYGTATCTTR